VNSFQGDPGKDILVPSLRFSTETRVSNSRFIATISPAFSVEEAKAFIRDIDKIYGDATHNVPVYQIGSGSSIIAHSSDNGEPSGTAGRPALSVLSGSGLSDTVMVITRYFGGTKLGTGGLVKAYSESARSVIQAVPKAKKITVHQCQISCPYHLYEQILRILRKSGCKIDQEDFTEEVLIHFLVPTNIYEILESQITNFSKGQIPIQINAANQTAIIPIR
jgi:uncharacterized YigZ family protein